MSRTSGPGAPVAMARFQPKPRPNQLVICTGSVVASRKPCAGGGDLGAGQAGEHGPAGAGVGQGLAEHRGGHGAVRGRRPRTGTGGRGWPHREVSSRSWSARAGRMRAWYSAWADSSPGVRRG